MSQTSQSHKITLPDGACLQVFEQGVGTPLLLISGLGGAAAFWNPCLPALTTAHRVIRLDQRGIGASTRGTAACTIDQLADDCIAVLDHLGIQSAILLGHSTGGCITQALALRSPQHAKACVLTGTWTKPNRYMQELFKLRKGLLQSDPMAYAVSATFYSHEPSWLNANWGALEAARAAAPLSPAAQNIVAERIDAIMAFDRSTDVARIKAPVLNIGARDDLIVPAFLQEELTALMPGSTLHLLEDGGHFFPVTRLTGFTAAVLSWAAQHV
ncbi:MAG: alpha/beta hydrolase [Alcaligenaceae bacterium]|nr:MAG: alpha/beta hydrolase [Alcaligenaceae bacterium]